MKSYEITRLPQYVKWRYLVKKRDGFKCMVCERMKNLNVHHILPKSKYPHKIFDVENGITLCRVCHILIKGEEHRFASTFLNLIANGVNSGKLPTSEKKVDNPEPSQESNLLEGLTTRSQDLSEESFIEKRVMCSQCGKPKWVANYRAQKSKNFFCSFHCQGVFKKNNNIGKDSWNWKDVKNFCTYCGKETHAPSRYSRRKKFCDNICQNAFQRDRQWSRKFERCNSCHRTDRKHKGKGLCIVCHLNKRKKNGLFGKVSNASTSALAERYDIV